MTSATRNNPRVLIIGYVWPEPASSAAGSRMIQLINILRQQKWQVTFASPSQKGEHTFNLSALGIDSQDILLNDSRFDLFVADLKPDYVIFDRFMMEEQFGWRVEKACPNAVRILDSEDLQFLRHARHEAIKQEKVLDKHFLHSELATREIASIYRCDLTLIISSFEMDLLENTFSIPKALLHYLPFVYADGQHQTTPHKPFKERKHFSCIGTFKHAPNWDAVLQLKHDIWPRIRKNIPSAELHIYGSYTPPKAQQLHNPKQGFYIKGWAPDALTAISDSRVLLAPLRFGAGLKGKLADAMLTATPSVTTPIGAEGMTPCDKDWGGTIADTWASFAEAACKLYQNENEWCVASQKAQQLLNSQFRLSDFDEALIECLCNIQSSLTEHRLQNFTGMMLRHHHHKSTQYMSQWIESKNQLKSVLETNSSMD